MNPTTDTLKRDLGRAVAAALKEAGIRQSDAADRTGIPLSTLSRRLGGYGKPFGVDELHLLAGLCGLRASDFLIQAAA